MPSRLNSPLNLLPPRLRLPHPLHQPPRHTRINTRHQPSPSLKHLKPLLNQRARLSIQRTVRIRLDQQTRDGNQHIAQRQPGIPVALQRLDAHAAALGVDVGVEDGRSEAGGWRALRVLGRDGQVEFPDAGGEGGVERAGEEDVEVGERVGVGGGWEEVVWGEGVVVEDAVVGC